MEKYRSMMSAIEVERRIRLEPYQIQQIAKKAVSVKETQIQDSYYDTYNYRYTTQDLWLRKRNGCFELKVGIKKENKTINRYKEITDEDLILKYLKLDVGVDLKTALANKNVSTFCSFLTIRKTYRLDEITVDIDDADFGDLRYCVAEIEMVVSHLSKIQDAEQKIEHFIKEFNIDISTPIPAKLIYYLYCKRPEHYQALIQNKIIKPISTACSQHRKR